MAYRFPLPATMLFLLPLAPQAHAGSRNLPDYPLRVHVYARTEHEHEYKGVLDRVEGEGKANLFENGVPRGMDFNYYCSGHLKDSSGYQTYPARWKAREKVLEIQLPVAGKKDAYDGCTLEVTMKDAVYVKKGGALQQETEEQFQAWMKEFNYDPEHGKNVPVVTAQKAQPPAKAPAASQPQASAPAGQPSASGGK